MAGIPANAYPLSLLDKLGIKVKASNQGDVALPTKLGDYLDRVIEGGDLGELNQLVPGINTAVVQLGKANPVVLLKALLASLDSSEAFMQTGSQAVDPDSTANFQHLTGLANYHAREIEAIADVAAEAGLHNHGMHFEVRNPEEFQSFIDRLSQVEEFSLDEKAKKLFNDIMVDMFDQPIELEHKIPQPELNRRIQYLEKLAQVGFAELKNDYSGKQVSSSAVVSGYKNLIENYSDDDNYRVAATELEKIMSPLHEIG
ncbi:MAG: hypothetical protein HOA17_01240 [Candidatus Melainabacteria bacterium]|jgi:hypothetical protein|nr:hypothetical protein [Candidatus Melainabacteria bacterium]